MISVRSATSIPLLLLLVACAPAPITNIGDPDSLRAEQPLQCVGLGAVVSTYTAADVAAGARSCVDEGKYESAAALVFVSSAMAFYDTQRVRDPSAHQALRLLVPAYLEGADEASRESLMAAIETATRPGSQASLCSELQRIGKPDYFPQYMIAHGMDAIMSSDLPPLVEEFDEEDAWRATLEFSRCVAPSGAS